MGQRSDFATMNKTKEWSKIGAWQGGSVSSVVLSPNFQNDGIALAATSAGIFRTESFGQQWALSMDGFSDPSALALALGQGGDGAFVLASSEQGRLFRSIDLGRSWAEIESWSGLGIGSALAISPDFATDKTFFVATPNGIFRTLDDGESWQEASFGLLDLDVICLAIAPDFAHSQTLWCGTALGGLFRTRNAGRAWRESGTGLPDCAVQSISLSPNFATDQTLFAGMEAGGVYRSQDGGRSWELAGEALAEIGVNALATVGDQLLAGTATGLYASIDGGETWTPQLADLPILDLALAENGAGLAAIYQQGIVARNLQTRDWQSSSTGIIAHAPPQVVQGSDGLLLALDNDGEMALSENGGADWQPFSSPDISSPVTAIAHNGFGDEECFYAASMSTLYCLPLNERQWHSLLLPPLEGDDAILQLAISHSAGQVTIALGTALGDVLRLDDEERAWQKLDSPWLGMELLALFFAADEAGEILHALTAGQNANQNYEIELWRFDDQLGGGWSNLAALESESPAVLTLATHDSIFLATQNRLIRLFVNAESGEKDVAQHFFAEGERITALAKSANSEELYTSTTGAIYRSNDAGGNWHEVAELPAAQPVVALLHSPDTQTLVAVTLGGSTWHRTA